MNVGNDSKPVLPILFLEHRLCTWKHIYILYSLIFISGPIQVIDVFQEWVDQICSVFFIKVTECLSTSIRIPPLRIRQINAGNNVCKQTCVLCTVIRLICLSPPCFKIFEWRLCISIFLGVAYSWLTTGKPTSFIIFLVFPCFFDCDSILFDSPAPFLPSSALWPTIQPNPHNKKNTIK